MLQPHSCPNDRHLRAHGVRPCCRTTRGARGRALAAVALTIALVAACSDPADEPDPPLPVQGELALDQAGTLVLASGLGVSTTGAVAPAGATLEVIASDTPGPTETDGGSSSSDDQEGRPALAGLAAALTDVSSVVNLHASAALTSPLTLTFPVDPDLTEPPADDLLASIWRYDPDLGWYPIAVADAAGQPATVERAQFSDHAVGWFQPQKWYSDATTSLGQFVGTRYPPPACAEPAPEWVDFTPPSLDLVHVCATTNTDQEAGERAEIQLVNNRGVTLQVSLPAGTAYAWVEGQNETVRQWVRDTVAGGADIVLLAPSQRMTVGFTRPPAGSPAGRYSIVTESSNAALTADLIGKLVDLGAGTDPTSMIYALAATAECADIRGWAFETPSGADAVTKVVDSVLACLVDTVSDPAQALRLARNAVGVTTGLSEAQVAADPALFSRVDQVQHAMRVLATVVKVVELAKLVPVYLEHVIELGFGLVAGAPLGATLVFTMPARPDKQPTAQRPPLTLDLGGGFVENPAWTSQQQTLDYLTRALGPPELVSSTSMCEVALIPGSMYRFTNLYVLFTDEPSFFTGPQGEPYPIDGPSLVGWYYIDIEAPDPWKLRTAEGVGLGSHPSDLVAAYPDRIPTDSPEVYEVLLGDRSNLTALIDLDTAEIYSLTSGYNCGD